MQTTMPPDFGLLHAIAVGCLFGAWFGYSLMLRFLARGSLNEQLTVVRMAWLTNATGRVQKPFDAILLGHIVNSIAFFGSATMIVLAGMITALASVRGVFGIVSDLHFTSQPTFELFVMNIAILNVILAFCFFSFTYALRKLIYVIALAGALRDASEDHPAAQRMVKAAATVLSEALKTFNFGIRGYYYFVAGLGLFVSPYLCLGLTALMTGILFYRQLGSRTAVAIQDYVDAVKNDLP